MVGMDALHDGAEAMPEVIAAMASGLGPEANSLVYLPQRPARY